MPRDKEHLDDMAKFLWERPTVKALMELAEMKRAWEPLAISAVASVIAAFAYLFFLEQATFALLWGSIVVVVLCPLSLGSYAVYMSQKGGVDQLYGTGDSDQDLAIGIGLCVVAFAFMCLACCKAGSVNLAVECLKATCECIRDMPTLLFEPIVALSIKIPVMAFLLFGFFYLGSCVSEVQKQVWTSSGLEEYVDIEYSPDVYWFLGFYGLMSIWIVEFVSALSQFAVAFATQQWWFSHYRASAGLPRGASSFAACTGLRIGVCYHFGTLAFGACIITLVRPVRFLLACIVPSTRKGASSNPCANCLAEACSCCISCFDRFLRFLTKNAYMDVAIHGSDFCKAAHHALLVLQNEATAVAVLNGATWLFQLTGLGAVSAAGAYTTHLMCKHIIAFGHPDSEYYIQDPLFLVGVSFCLCFLVAMPFMLVFDQVSDTILFCFAVEHQRSSRSGRGSFTPLAGETGKDESRAPETQALLRRAGLPGR